MSALKLCPYCGGKAEHICNNDKPVRGLESIPGAYEGKYWHYVRCTNCNNQLSGLFPADSEELIRQWNTRPIEDKYSVEAVKTARILCFPHELREDELDLQALAKGMSSILQGYAQECDRVEHFLRKALNRVDDPSVLDNPQATESAKSVENFSIEPLAEEAARLIFCLKEENVALRNLVEALRNESSLKSQMYNAWLKGGKESSEFKTQRESWVYADHAVEYATAALRDIENGKLREPFDHTP